MAERLQKLIARAGLASRRSAEAMIEAGLVRVNGKVVTELGTRADPATDRITVEGRPLPLTQEKVYLLFRKPRNVVATLHDPERRPALTTFLRKVRHRVYPVGRLPFEAEGLLLLTNDGELAGQLLQATLPQTYAVRLKSRLKPGEIEKLAERASRYESGGFVFRPVRRGPNPWYEAVLTSSKTDWLRTWLHRLGHPVEKLARVAIGPVRDDKLAPGACRDLTGLELRRLRELAAKTGPRKRKATPTPRARRRKIR